MTVVVEMKGDPVAVVQAQKGRDLTTAERNSVKSTLKKAQDAIAGSIKNKGGKIQANMQSAYNGIQVSIPATQVDAVAALPNVVAVHAVKTYTLDNAVSVPFLGVPQVWQNTGYTGKNVKVAVIDTGIDYTHANFGGPGTVAAYDAAHADEAQPADPALFGPAAPRVKGGYDFVGDAYNADPQLRHVPAGAAPRPQPARLQRTRQPRRRYRGGSGVTADGATYPGPYDAIDARRRRATIGPGVAPQADLYALRVFGCDGSTERGRPKPSTGPSTTAWTSSTCRSALPSAAATTPTRSPRPTRSAPASSSSTPPATTDRARTSRFPGNGDGVISVAAVDSTQSFPGATITVDGVGDPRDQRERRGPVGRTAARPSCVSSTILPTTAENESLGCSVAAYTARRSAPGRQPARRRRPVAPAPGSRRRSSPSRPAPRPRS